MGKHCGKYKFFKILPDGVQPLLLRQLIIGHVKKNYGPENQVFYNIHRLNFTKNLF